MYCFVILLLFNEMQMSVRRFSAIPHLRGRMCVKDVMSRCSSRYVAKNLRKQTPIGRISELLMAVRKC